VKYSKAISPLAVPKLESKVVKRIFKATMREIVSDAKSSPSKVKPRRLPPGIHDGFLIDRNGLTHSLLKKEISPDEAVQFVKSGAQVVFDACGCGGICGFVYAPVGELDALTKSKPVLSSHKGLNGSLSLWRSENGETIVLAEGPVNWN
jgi:hypothetical protein